MPSRHRPLHSLAAVLVCCVFGGCTATQLGLPDFPLGTPPAPARCSLKDCKPATQPTNAPASVVRPLSP